MKYVTPRFILGIALGVALVGTAVASAGQSGPAQSKLKVALVLPCPTNDGSWCQQAFVAAKRLEREGRIQLKFTSNAPQDTQGAAQVIQRYITGGSQLVLAHSAWQDAAFNAARRFPNTPIVYGGGGRVGNNVSTYEEPIYLPAYLAGMLAAGISKTGVIGGLAAFDIPLCHAQMEAFRLGAKRVKKSVRQITTYIGDWNDVAKGKNATLAAADQRADVFTVCGGGPASGMISALKERNLSGFGYVGNQNSLAPKHMVGSLVYNLYPIFKAIVADVQSGKYKGKVYDLGLRSFNFPINPKYSAGKIPPRVMKQMKTTQKAILAGKFKVPYRAS